MKGRHYNMLFEADDGTLCMARWKQGVIIVDVLGKSIQISLEQMTLNPDKKKRIAKTMQVLVHKPLEETKSWAEIQRAKFTQPS